MTRIFYALGSIFGGLAVALGSIFGGLAVALGAFGAHGMANILTPERLIIYETAVRY